jgi:DnaK suppressor protein
MANGKKSGTTVATMPTRARYGALKRILETRQRDILSEVKGKIRGVRAERAEKPHDVRDSGETSEGDVQEEIELALIQMKAETLDKINEALSRLDNGTYGHCFGCGGEIAEARLRALPFAVRCKGCEESREMAQRRERMHQRLGSTSRGFDMRE